MIACLVPLGALLIASGCDYAGERDSEICRQGPAEPLSVAMALSVLRANDYQMTSLESNGTCALERVVGFLSNSPNASKPLFENAQAHGHLLCHVETHDILPESKIKAVPHGDYKTILFAENVRCTIYPRGADKDKQVADLKSALTELVERSPGG